VNVAGVLQTCWYRFHVKEVILFLFRIVNIEVDIFENVSVYDL